MDIRIESVEFGRMCIGKTVYTTDLIIYPDHRVVDRWRRTSGHKLGLADIGDLVASAPEIIVVGTGINDRMRLTPGLIEALESLGIAIEAMPTPEAAERFNALKSHDRIAGCFHLTC